MFFRFIFWVVVLLFLFRWLFPWFIKMLLQRRHQNFYDTPPSQKPFSKPTEGKTTIDKKPRPKKTISDDLGDYIKYEELDEN